MSILQQIYLRNDDGTASLIDAPTDVTLVDQALWTDDSAMEDDEIVGLSFRKATPKTFLGSTTNMYNNLL